MIFEVFINRQENEKKKKKDKQIYKSKHGQTLLCGNQTSF